MEQFQINRYRNEILAIARKHGAVNVRVFGSIARGDLRPEIDVDLLVDVTDHVSPWFPVRLIDELRQLLHREVDVVTERALHPLLRDRVLREARPI